MGAVLGGSSDETSHAMSDGGYVLWLSYDLRAVAVLQ